MSSGNELEVEVQRKGERDRGRVRVLSDAEKDAVWDKIRSRVPMIHVYEKRTDRNIRVFRISRLAEEVGSAV